MEQRKINRPCQAGISEHTHGGNLSAADFTTRPHKIQPRFSIADVDAHLLKFNYTGQITKRVRVIAWLHLCVTCGYVVTSFDSIRVGDFNLATTISQIGSRSGLVVERRAGSRPTRFGTSTHVKEFWFPSTELLAVVDFLGGFRQKVVV